MSHEPPPEALLSRRASLGSAVLASGAALFSGDRATAAGLPQVRPEEIRLDPRRLQAAYDLMARWTTGPDAPVPGGAILVGRFGKTVAPRFLGRQGPEAD